MVILCLKLKLGYIPIRNFFMCETIFVNSLTVYNKKHSMTNIFKNNLEYFLPMIQIIVTN